MIVLILPTGIAAVVALALALVLSYWGAYRRRAVVNEKSQWQEECERALQAADGSMCEHHGAWQMPFDPRDTSKDRQVR